MLWHGSIAAVYKPCGIGRLISFCAMAGDAITPIPATSGNPSPRIDTLSFGTRATLGKSQSAINHLDRGRVRRSVQSYLTTAGAKRFIAAFIFGDSEVRLQRISVSSVSWISSRNGAPTRYSARSVPSDLIRR